jgi:hypothetical protein
VLDSWEFLSRVMSGQNGNLSAIENHELSFGTAMKTKRGFGTGQAQSTSTCLGQNQKRFRIRVIDGAPVAQLDRASAFEGQAHKSNVVCLVSHAGNFSDRFPS